MCMNKKAFTIIELMVVILVVGILSGFFIIQFNEVNDQAKDAKRMMDIESIANAVVLYSSDHQRSKPSTNGVACEINNDCPVEFSQSLAPYLAVLPSDPNLETYYIYKSDGNECTISAILSNGKTYEYSCSSDLSTIKSSVNGECGLANNSNYYDPPTTNLCNQGTASASGSWSWDCEGLYDGLDVSCSANKSVNGECGLANNSNYYDPPTTNLCNQGTASASGSWSWDCEGLYDGLDVSCSANKSVNGECGLSNNSILPSPPTTNLCNKGTASASGSWSWTCYGTNGGSNSSTCSATYGINGSCSSTEGVCISGTASSVTYVDYPSGYANWTCSGTGAGSSANCSGPRLLYGGVHNADQCSSIGMTYGDYGACGVFDYPACFKSCGIYSDCYPYGPSVPAGWSVYSGGGCYVYFAY